MKVVLHMQLQFNLRTHPEVDPVYDLHLLEEGRLAGLSGAQQQDLDHPLETALLHLQIAVDAPTLDPPLHLLGTFLSKKRSSSFDLKVTQCSLLDMYWNFGEDHLCQDKRLSTCRQSHNKYNFLH